MLQGEVTPDVLALAGPDMTLPLTVGVVFDDGMDANSDQARIWGCVCGEANTAAQVLAIMGNSVRVRCGDALTPLFFFLQEDGSAVPSINLRTRLGGVRYRLKTVSKRLGNRALCVTLALDQVPGVARVVSEPTTVYSKRKNRDQRIEEQARERAELEARQSAAQALLDARTSPTADGTSGAVAPSPFSAVPAMPRPAAPFFPPPPSHKPRRNPVAKHFVDLGDDSDDDGQPRKRVVRPKTSGMSSSEASRIRKLEDKVLMLESQIEEQNTKMEQIQGTINLYGLGNPRPSGLLPPAMNRSISQNILWTFSDPSSTELPSIVSPQPRNQEVDQWSALVNSTAANGAAGDAKRDAYHPAAGPRRTPSALSF